MPRGGHGGVSIGETGGHSSNSNSGNHTGERISFSSRGLGERPGGKFSHGGDRDREKIRDRDREMVGGCCVCSDERGWDENPLVYCDGHGCNVAVHQACYGIVSVPTGPWFCRKCESQERAARVRCELCPNKDGGLKRTDTNSWAHVVCALYIPEVRFGNVSTMEPIVLGLVPQERYLKVCYLCEQQGRESRASSGACMQCNKSGCKQSFHVTCAQRAGLLCEEAGNYMDNVKYCGYCEYHHQRINKKFVKNVPAYRPTNPSNSVFERISDDERNSPRSTSSPDHKRAHLDLAAINSTSSPTNTKSISNSAAPLTGSTSDLNSTLDENMPGSSITESKGDRGGGDSSSVVSSSSSSSKKGKKGRKPNSEKGSSEGIREGKLEPSKFSLESSSAVDTSSTISGGIQKPDKDIDGKFEINLNKSSTIGSNAGALNNKASDYPSLTTQNSKDLSTTAIDGNLQNSTSTHNSQLKEDTTRRSTPSAASGISSKPSAEDTKESSSYGISTSVMTSKPPSVIVKFGKQDGTYYSKKDPTPSQSVSMSNSSTSAVTNSSINLISSGSANNISTSDNTNDSVSGHRPATSSSQSHHHRDHRHGRKHSSSMSKANQKDYSSISTNDSPNVTQNNGLDTVTPKLEVSESNGSVQKSDLPVDFTSTKQPNQNSSFQLPSQNIEKGVSDGPADNSNKGFTNANFTESVVTPSSSVGASIFGKGTVNRNLPSSSYHDQEYNQSRSQSSNSTEKRNVSHASHGASSFTGNKNSTGGSVTTSLIKNEPLDFVKKDSNHESSNATSSSRSTTGLPHNAEKSISHHKANVDLKITKYGTGDNSTLSIGKPSQGHGTYNKHSYESSSLREEKFSLGAVSVSKSTHSMPEPKKDSPAKILPISASTTSPEKGGINSGTSSASFGRPLKVEVSSGSASRSSSLEVSPVKRTDDGVRRDLSPSKTAKDIGSKVSSKASGKRLGRPPKKGTHLNINSLGHLASSPPARASSTENNGRKRSPQSSPEREAEDHKKRRKRSPSKRLTNGQRESSEHTNSRDRLWMMMGATLNPNSSMAEEMDIVLKHEVQAHSVYDNSMQATYRQVPLPGGKRSHVTKSSTTSASTNASSQDGSERSGANKDQPQTLDELLERQWEQGSQFLMEQASHFDIASLLSSLHQLKEENLDLEDSVDRMVQRRDHLLAVRARLLALSSLTVASPNTSTNQTGGSGTPTGVGSSHTTPERERYTAAVAHQTGQSPVGGTTVVNLGTSNGPSPSSGRNSAHVSPRNSAATISPIRIGGGNAIISPRAPPILPPPPSTQTQMPSSIDRSIPAHSSSNSSASIYMQPPPAHSPRDRINSRPSSGGPLGVGPPPSHQIPGAPSPRDRGQAPSPRHITGSMTPSPHLRDARLSPRVPSSTTVIHTGSATHGSIPLENGVDYHHGGPHHGALPPPPHGAIPISSPTPNLPPGTMIHSRNPGSAHNIPPGHGDLGPPRSSGPVSSAHLLSVASHHPAGRGVSVNTTGSAGPPTGGGALHTTYTSQPQTSAIHSGPPPRQSSMSYAPASSSIPGGMQGQQQAHIPSRSSPHHPPPPGTNIHASQRGVPPHIPSSLGGGATTIMTAVSSTIGPPHNSGLPPVPPRSTGGMMIRPMGSHGGPPGNGGGVGTSYRPGAPPRNYYTMAGGPHGPPHHGHIGVPSRSPTPMNAQQASMRAGHGRMMGPNEGLRMMHVHPQDKR